MAKIRSVHVLCGAALLIFLGLVITFNVINFSEAYGSGPPYYSRTTNMDKWSSPLPLLTVVDAVSVLAIVLCFYMLRRKD
nr:hypothetical protein [Paraburkholderia silvatlantica]